MILLVLACLVVIPTLNCKKEPEEISVRLKWVYISGFAGDMVALKEGIFEKNKLDVTVHEGGLNLDPIKLVASGSDQFGLAGAEQIMLARSQGIPLVCIAVVYQYSPVAFVSKKGSGIETPQDFEGRKVGVKPGTDIMPIYEALLKKAGIDRSKIEEIQVQFSLIPFLEDQVDVHPTYVTNEPLTLDQMGVEYIVIDPKDYGVDAYGMCYFTTEEMINEHPDVVERYLKSVLEGWSWSLENKDEATTVVLSFNEKLDSTVQRKMFDAIEPLLLNAPEGKIGWMERERWEATQQVYLDVGMLEQPVDLDSVFTTKFLEKIYK
ncbi:Riboflavin-binding protein RibY [subsurface metagenome]